MYHRRKERLQAAVRAAKTIGCRKIITYTLDVENKAGIRAVGWKYCGLVSGTSWTGKRNPIHQQYPAALKMRYEKTV